MAVDAVRGHVPKRCFTWSCIERAWVSSFSCGGFSCGSGARYRSSSRLPVRSGGLQISSPVSAASSRRPVVESCGPIPKSTTWERIEKGALHVVVILSRRGGQTLWIVVSINHCTFVFVLLQYSYFPVLCALLFRVHVAIRTVADEVHGGLARTWM